jgi:hypothetical protein
VTAETPGQAVHDTVISRRMARGEEPGVIAWQNVPDADKADLEAGVQAAIVLVLAGITAELRELRERAADRAAVVTGETPGQAAHRRWHEVRWPDSDAGRIAHDWQILSNRAKAAWEAAAGMHAPPELTAAVKAAVVAEIREAASCESDDEDRCEKCNRHADAILAIVAGRSS